MNIIKFFFCLTITLWNTSPSFSQLQLISEQQRQNLQQEIEKTLGWDSTTIAREKYKILHTYFLHYHEDISKKFNPKLITLQEYGIDQPKTFSLIMDSAWNVKYSGFIEWQYRTALHEYDKEDLFVRDLLLLWKSKEFDYVCYLEFPDVKYRMGRLWGIKKNKPPVIFMISSKGLTRYTLKQYLRCCKKDLVR